ncbi:universal stress protein [Herminiimonas fonticola]|uniref:Nucleotide-binding universal stress UspA family protein n=1 Tax=Herminiimonas fonticola TaxID=303380 RepID=A0A4R6G1C6_9BURK|nr:universal stress protein [Herminiimonas fonticola]RBA23621.1 Universal stress protein UspA and related nucleotide-binding protein [Herminiimonas fonticola]TDN88027.1 nucleotide-binding universal stress UspA family protein [Herminiimonas fonticola]
MFKTILLATDGSDASIKAIRSTIEFAKENHSKIIGLSVEESHPYFPYAATDKAEEFAKDNVRKIADLAAAAKIRCEVHTERGSSPYKEIIESAQRYGCDSIFLGSHGLKGVDRILLGSVAQKVLIHSSVPVVIIK